jgi:ABC-type molybdenum transport system ATPase subunit/photorepair protein PhrA
MATVEEHNEKAAQKVIRRINDLRELWNMPSGAGKRVLMEIIDESGVNKSPYSNSGQAMAHKVGKAEVGHKLREQITMAGIEITARECMNITKADIEAYFNKHINIIKNRGGVE